MEGSLPLARGLQLVYVWADTGRTTRLKQAAEKIFVVFIFLEFRVDFNLGGCWDGEQRLVAQAKW